MDIQSHFNGLIMILWLFGLMESAAMDSVATHDEESPLVVNDVAVQTPKSNYTRDVYILSISFLLIFLAYGAAQNLETTVNTVSFILNVLEFLILISDVWLNWK